MQGTGCLKLSITIGLYNLRKNPDQNIMRFDHRALPITTGPCVQLASQIERGWPPK